MRFHWKKVLNLDTDIEEGNDQIDQKQSSPSNQTLASPQNDDGLKHFGKTSSRHTVHMNLKESVEEDHSKEEERQEQDGEQYEETTKVINLTNM